MVGEPFPREQRFRHFSFEYVLSPTKYQKNVTFFDSLRQLSQCVYKQESDDGLDHLYLVNLDPFSDLVCFSVGHRSFWSNNKLPYGARK